MPKKKQPEIKTWIVELIEYFEVEATTKKEAIELIGESDVQPIRSEVDASEK